MPSNNGCPDGSYRVTWQKSMGFCYDMQQKWGLDKATFEKCVCVCVGGGRLGVRALSHAAFLLFSSQRWRPQE
jgi:hypothetical protein